MVSRSSLIIMPIIIVKDGPLNFQRIPVQFNRLFPCEEPNICKVPCQVTERNPSLRGGLHVLSSWYREEVTNQKPTVIPQGGCVKAGVKRAQECFGVPRRETVFEWHSQKI